MLVMSIHVIYDVSKHDVASSIWHMLSDSKCISKIFGIKNKYSVYVEMHGFYIKCIGPFRYVYYIKQ